MPIPRIAVPVSLAVCVVCAVVIQGCGNTGKTTQVKSSATQPAAPKPAGIPGVSHKNIPHFDGSTSARPLVDLIRHRACGLNGELRRLRADFNFLSVTYPAKMEPDQMKALEAASSNEELWTSTNGTHQAYVNLLMDRVEDKQNTTARRRSSQPPADIILVAREPSEDELALAKENGVEMDVRPVALDAFVFLVNAKNPVKSLTLDQLRDVFSGSVKNWKELGGGGEPIQAFTRNPNSGSQELMEKLVMKDREMMRLPGRILVTMVDVIDAVAENPAAISYSVYYYEEFIAPNYNNRLLAIDGVLPTAETIADRSYPLATEVYVVTRKGIPADSPAAKIRDWLLSEDGQELVAKSGYVPIGNKSK